VNFESWFPPLVEVYHSFFSAVFYSQNLFYRKIFRDFRRIENKKNKLNGEAIGMSQGYFRYAVDQTNCAKLFATKSCQTNKTEHEIVI